MHDKTRRERSTSNPASLPNFHSLSLTIFYHSPVLSPAVANAPIHGARLYIGTPTSDGNNVIGTLRVRVVGEDAAQVVDNRFGIDGCGDWTTDKDFRHDVDHDILVEIDHTVLGDRRVGEVVNFGTRATHTRKGIACLARIGSATARIHVLAKAVDRFFTAGQVGLARIVRHKPTLLDHLVHARVVAAVAAAGHFGSAVENVLDGEIDITTGSQTRNLDAIRKAAQRSVRPTGTTVLCAERKNKHGNTS